MRPPHISQPQHGSFGQYLRSGSNIFSTYRSFTADGSTLPVHTIPPGNTATVADYDIYFRTGLVVCTANMADIPEVHLNSTEEFQEFTSPGLKKLVVQWLNPAPVEPQVSFTFMLRYNISAPAYSTGNGSVPAHNNVSHQVLACLFFSGLFSTLICMPCCARCGTTERWPAAASCAAR